MTNYVENGTTGDDVIQNANWTTNDHVTSNLRAGDDTYIGWGAAYLVRGGDGKDSISGGWSGGTMYGDGGDDRLVLQATGFNHTGYGGAGNDYFFAWFNNGGALKCYGGTGIDRFEDAHSGSPDLFDGGDGFDYVVDTNSSEGITVSLTAGSGSGGNAASNTYVSIEGLGGSNHGDQLTGNGEKNTLLGDNGADTLSGGGEADLLIGNDFSVFFSQFTGARAGGPVFKAFSYTDSDAMNNTASDDDGAADQLLGGAGDDVLIGGLGADTLNGGLGTDAANYIDSDVGITVNLLTKATAGDSAVGDKFISIENILGSVSADKLTGDAGANMLRGRGGNDTLSGGAGGDNLLGESEDDQLDGGAGADTLAGGGGNDTYIVDNIGDEVKEAAGAGIDTVRSSVTHTLAAGADHLVLTRNAAIDGTGNSLANAITGNGGANELDGKLGLDTLTGGLGADRFTFSTKPNGATNVDVIEDYRIAADSIALKQTAFAGLTLGALAEDAFVTGGAAADNEDRIIYNEATGALSFDADGARARFQAVQFATLDAGLAMVNTEFIIF